MRANRKRKTNRSQGPLSHKLPVWAISVAMVLVIGSILFDYHSVPLYLQLLREVEEVHTQIRHLEQQNAMLRQDIVRIEHDPVKLEELARNRLGMVRPDELVYQFIVPQPSLPSATP